MLLPDVRNKGRSKEMYESCGVREEQLSKLFEGNEKFGKIQKSIAEKLGFGYNVGAYAGAGDNAAAAVGTGTVGNGKRNISVGNSGTIFQRRLFRRYATNGGQRIF